MVSIKQSNFDFDGDSYIRLVSIAKQGVKVPMSLEGDWKESEHEIVEKELNTSLDVQIIKTSASDNNNVVFFVTNQYGRYLPFFAIPIGGVPKYRSKIGMKQYEKK